MNTKFYSFIDTQTEHDMHGNYPDAKRIDVTYLSTLYALLQQYALTKLCKHDNPDVLFDADPWEDENDPRTCQLYRFRNRNPTRRSPRKRQQQYTQEENITKRSKADTINLDDDQSEPSAKNNKRKHTSEHTSDDHTSGNRHSRQSKQQKTQQDSEDVDGSVDVDDDNNMDTCLLCSDGGGE